MLTDEEINELVVLEAKASASPWIAWIEGETHSSGDSFIQVGTERSRLSDLYLVRDGGEATVDDLRFIAAARTALPHLLDEIRRIRDGATGR